MRSREEELRESRRLLISRFTSGEISNNFQRDHTEIIDQYFRRGLEDSKVGRQLFNDKLSFAFVATGGYGRKEVCIHSDIDILILFSGKIPSQARQLIQETLFPLWDLGFTLGYGTRSVKDCVSLSRNDFEVLASLIDGRFICGNSGLFLSLLEALESKVISKRQVAFQRWLEDRHAIRKETSGDASYLLEPDVKEGIGGLRDYHEILWLARTFFNLRTPRDLEYSGMLSHGEYHELRERVEFLSVVRNHLHQLSNRRNDRLSFEYQEKIADRLGFEDKDDVLGVEQFMGRLHGCMASMKCLHRSFIDGHLPGKRHQGKGIDFPEVPGLHFDRNGINFDSATTILSNRHLLMAVFEESARTGCPLSLEARRLVREFLFLVDESFRESERVVNDFNSIIRGPNTLQALDQMFEIGFLEAFIPEFGKIRDRVQFDTYHIYPVGRHLLETLRYLKNLSSQKEMLLLDIFSDLLNPQTLFLAALLHDIGKDGKDHAQRGVEIARGILKRIGYDKKGTEDILFLVRHHLILAETATRRDLNDEKAIVQCAREIKDADRLKMLYLLTWADSMATGPRVWNTWVANLAQELFFKVMHILERGELATEDAAKTVSRKRAAIRQELSHQMADEDLNSFLEVMPPRYFQNTRTRDIIGHIELAKEFRELYPKKDISTFSLDTRKSEREGYYDLTFMAKDRPGLFADVAGVLALNDINILSADITTWSDGTAVDSFKVTGPLDRIHPEEVWARVNSNLNNVFSGKLSLVYRLSKKAAPSILSDKRRPRRPPHVIVDNHISDFFTLIEVFADDRIGLLYLITRTLFDLRLDIRIAKIATKGDQVADVFYVRDLEGQKVEDAEHVKEIEEALYHELSQG
ncbi:MAG: [protein-PII] uridylyltransferase [Pseudomonadota bacterium]